MYSDELLKQYVVKETNFTQATQTEAKPQEIKPDAVNMPNALVPWGPIGFVTAWVAIFLLLTKMRKVSRDQIVVNLNPLNKVPCRNCRFFSGNPHLKCAVHPATVLTSKAIDCSDYWPHDGKFPQ